MNRQMFYVATLLGVCLSLMAVPTIYYTPDFVDMNKRDLFAGGVLSGAYMVLTSVYAGMIYTKIRAGKGRTGKS